MADRGESARKSRREIFAVNSEQDLTASVIDMKRNTGTQGRVKPA
jgi:hypothetical protein